MANTYRQITKPRDKKDNIKQSIKEIKHNQNSIISFFCGCSQEEMPALNISLIGFEWSVSERDKVNYLVKIDNIAYPPTLEALVSKDVIWSKSGFTLMIMRFLEDGHITHIETVIMDDKKKIGE